MGRGVGRGGWVGGWGGGTSSPTVSQSLSNSSSESFTFQSDVSVRYLRRERVYTQGGFIKGGSRGGVKGARGGSWLVGEGWVSSVWRLVVKADIYNIKFESVRSLLLLDVGADEVDGRSRRNVTLLDPKRRGRRLQPHRRTAAAEMRRANVARVRGRGGAAGARGPGGG